MEKSPTENVPVKTIENKRMQELLHEICIEIAIEAKRQCPDEGDIYRFVNIINSTTLQVIKEICRLTIDSQMFAAAKSFERSEQE